MSDVIPTRFFHQAETLGPKPLFYVKRDKAYRAVTWQDAADQVMAFAGFLIRQGVNPGDRVVILSENRPEWGIADLAIQSVGAWTVPIYPSLAVQDIRVICEDCQPILGIASTNEQASKLVEVRAQCPSTRAIIVMEAMPSSSPLVMGWSETIAVGRQDRSALRPEIERRLSCLQPDSTATLLYTSGTTGEPKGVMLSHGNILSNVTACLQVIPISGADLHLSFLPLSHIFERMAGWYLMLSVGARVAYAESMETIPENMREIRPTVMLGVPRFFEKLALRVQEALQQLPPAKRRLANWALGVGRAYVACLTEARHVPRGLALKRLIADRAVFRKLRVRLGGRLRFFVSGSAPLSKEIGEFFYSVGITILEGYGLTETSPVISANRLHRPRFGSVGQLLPGVEVRIAEDGEILTRGPHVMQGYYQQPEATSAAIVEGWFHTGDIGRMDDEGFLYITDRKKDLIKTAGGKFVAPQKLENLFVTDPYISQAVVYGDRRPYCVALIVPNMDQLRRYAQEQEIAARSTQELVCNQRILDFYWRRVEAKQQGLASFEQVKKIALLDEEFSQATGELTPTLKAKRTIICKRYEPLLEALYQPTAS